MVLLQHIATAVMMVVFIIIMIFNWILNIIISLMMFVIGIPAVICLLIFCYKNQRETNDYKN